MVYRKGERECSAQDLKPRQVRRTALILLGGVVLLLMLALAIRVATSARVGRAQTGSLPLEVEVVAARVQPMPVLVQAVGQVVSRHTVRVRPQISGMLERVLFTEGESVSAGQRLFRIEPAPFEATLAAAKAAWDNARGNADRLETLLQQAYVTPQDYRNARAVANQTEAAYRQAQINLSYTSVRAPIAGRTGSLAVKSGNVVSPADTAPLVIINEMHPIEVQFSIPQQFLARVRRYQQAEHAIKVVVTGDDGVGDLDEGPLVFIDNTVNVNTGTVTLKAQLPNAKEQLWPGQYVGVRMQLTLESRAVVVPQTAVQTGQDGNYLYVVEGGEARRRSIAVDRQVGDLTVISSGLTGGEEVVLKVPRGLRPGLHVTIAGSAAPRAEVTLPQSE